MKNIFSAFKRTSAHLLEPMWRTVQHAYFENGDGMAQSRRNILAQNLTFSLTSNITGGIFLTGLLLIILENEPVSVQNHYIGLISTVQVLAGIMQFFSPMITRRLKFYRIFGLCCRYTFHFLNIFALGALPFLPLSATGKATAFILIVFVMNSVLNISTPALMRWHVGTCIPEDKRNNWFSIKQLVLPIITALVNLGSGFIVDQFDLRGQQLTGILVLRGIALFFLLLELRTHFKIKETPYPTSDQSTSLKDMIVEPMKDKRARAVLLISIIWRIATQIPGQYFNAYLLEDLQVDYTFITACSATAIPLMMIMMPLWNKMVRRKDWLPSFWLSSTLYVLPALLNCLTFGNTWWLYLVSVLYTNTISPGFNLCLENLPYLYRPKTNHTAFLSLYQGVSGIASFLGALIGKYFIQLTDGITIPFFGHQIINRQYIWLFTFAGLVILSVVVAVTIKNWNHEQANADAIETTGVVKSMQAHALCDTHTHTLHSHDGRYSVAQMAQAAAEKGISVLTVTDHCDIEYYKERGIFDRIRRSVEEVEAYHGPITVLRGIEVGEAIWDMDYTYEVLDANEFDVIIGSIHAVRHPILSEPYSYIDFTDVPDALIDEYMHTYFRDMLEMLRTVPCDVLAHMTCPLRYITGKYHRPVDTRNYRTEITQILSYIIEHGIALEINTSSQPPMPDEWIIHTYRELGGQLITLGSDAHVPEHIGRDFTQTLTSLKGHGFTHYGYFHDRIFIPVKL